MRVLKFGGSSLATAETIRQVVEVVRGSVEDRQVAVVVSAFGGVTDELLTAARTAEENKDGWKQIVQSLETRHLSTVSELAVPSERPTLEARVQETHRELYDLLLGVSMVREVGARPLAR
ncbi:MAG: bifunctional aspartate kinase/homoserine dehydrogenase I, partial [Acidobacteriota bacterium]|nr:bifunctional aspartate kinase/homoserine dehydrogenase I [Acidobacteriota bacterium]